MQPYPAPALPAPGRRRGRALVLGGAILLVLALVGGIVAAVAIARVVVRTAEGSLYERLEVPGEYRVELAGGSQAVYLLGEDVEAVGAATAREATRVTGPDGETLPLRPTRFDETLTLDSDEFVAIGRFEAGQAGPHDVTIDAPVGGTAVVGPSVGSVLGWVFGGGGRSSLPPWPSSPASSC